MSEESKETAIEKQDTSVMLNKETGVPVGFEDYDGDEDLQMMPRIKVCQNTSKEAKKNGVPEGEFYNTLSFEHWPTIRFIIAMRSKSRVLHGEKMSDPNRCYSNDGAYPNSPEPININCAECKENRKKPEDGGGYGNCNLVENFIIKEVDSKFTSEALLSFKSTQYKIAKQILAGLRHTNKNLWSYVFKANIVEMEGNNGAYFSMVIPRDRPTTEEEQQAAHNRFLIFSSEQINYEEKNETKTKTENGVEQPKDQEEIPFMDDDDIDSTPPK